MGIKKLCLGVIVVCVLPACQFLIQKVLFRPAKLKLTRENYTQNNLRINGYYYEKGFDGSVYEPLKSYQETIRPYFFHRNGVMYTTDYYYSFEELEEKEKWFKSSRFDSLKKASRTGWGVFKVEVDTIILEHWIYLRNNGVTNLRRGLIVNDSLLVFKHRVKVSHLDYKLQLQYKARNIKEIYIDDTLYFRPYSHRLDSICPFINY